MAERVVPPLPVLPHRPAKISSVSAPVYVGDWPCGVVSFTWPAILAAESACSQGRNRYTTNIHQHPAGLVSTAGQAKGGSSDQLVR